MERFTVWRYLLTIAAYIWTGPEAATATVRTEEEPAFLTVSRPALHLVVLIAAAFCLGHVQNVIYLFIYFDVFAWYATICFPW